MRSTLHYPDYASTRFTKGHAEEIVASNEVIREYINDVIRRQVVQEFRIGDGKILYPIPDEH